MSVAFDFATPQQAVKAMIKAGAVFNVRRREDALGFSFSYSIDDGGDLDQGRRILAKIKPAAFYEAFRAAVQNQVAAPKRGAA